MRKTLSVLATSFLVILIIQQANAHLVAANINENLLVASNVDSASYDNIASSSTEGTEDLEVIFERLYDEGYTLGKEDGYNEKAYENFGEEADSDMSSAEFNWFKIGYTVGYQKGKRQKEAEVQTKQEEEFKSGEDSGYEQGLIDYKNKTIEPNPPSNPSQSEQWNEGYIAGYKKAVQLMDLSISAKDEGYEQGLKQENIDIHSKYINAELTKKAFEEGFKTGEKERITKLKKKYTKQGYEHGYKLQSLTARDDIPDEAKSAFEEGYQKGYNARKSEVIESGFNDAFTYVTYQIPNEYKNQPILQEWHKKGFKSNKDAKSLRNEAHQSGKAAESFKIPKNYENNKAATVVYHKYYQLGKAEREKMIGKMLIAGGILLSAVATGGYMLFRRKKTGDKYKMKSA